MSGGVDVDTLLTIFGTLAFLMFLVIVLFRSAEGEFSLFDKITFRFKGKKDPRGAQKTPQQVGMTTGDVGEIQAHDVVGGDKHETHIHEASPDNEALSRIQDSIDKLREDVLGEKDSDPLKFSPAIEEAAEYFKCRLLIEKKLAVLALSYAGHAMGRPEWDIEVTLMLLKNDHLISNSLVDAINEFFDYTYTALHAEPPYASPLAPAGMPIGSTSEETLALVKELASHIMARLDMVEIGPLSEWGD